jgi:hypothetical protein
MAEGAKAGLLAKQEAAAGLQILQAHELYCWAKQTLHPCPSLLHAAMRAWLLLRAHCGNGISDNSGHLQR